MNGACLYSQIEALTSGYLILFTSGTVKSLLNMHQPPVANLPGTFLRVFNILAGEDRGETDVFAGY